LLALCLLSTRAPRATSIICVMLCGLAVLGGEA
jgi:hypothetical protein